MRQVRRSVFETNSSSTHSICITSERKPLMRYPTKIRFNCGTFGWEERKYTSPEMKASYFYSMLLCILSRKEAEEAVIKIWDMLYEEGIECEFESPVYDDDIHPDWCENAYVDHAGEDDAHDFVKNLLRNKGRLLRYLFSEDSFVLTGNDNSYTDVRLSVDYKHEEYYKGN